MSCRSSSISHRPRVWIGVALIALVSTACDSGPHTTIPRPPPGAPITYVALGDSYPAGDGPAGGESYVDHYEALIEQRSDTEVEVTDLAAGGATTADLLATISMPQSRAALQAAQLVTITIGGNDFLQAAGACGAALPCFEGTLTDIGDRLNEVAARVRAEAPGALILMTNYPDVVAGNQVAVSFLGLGSLEVAREVFTRSSEVVCSVAARHGMTCVDVYRSFNGPDGGESAHEKGLLAADIIHPSTEGHRVIAELLCGIACE